METVHFESANRVSKNFAEKRLDTFVLEKNFATNTDRFRILFRPVQLKSLFFIINAVKRKTYILTNRLKDQPTN